MSERTHNTLIGAFVLGGIVITVAVLLYVLGGGVSKSTQRVVMVFDGSVKGLTIGAPVALRGVNIGQVTDIRVLFEELDGINLLMEVEAVLDMPKIQRQSQSLNALEPQLLTAGLRAQLNSQSLLTGLLYIQLDFFPDTPIVKRQTRSDLFEIPTIPSTRERLVSQFDDLDLPKLANDMQVVADSMRRFSENPEFQDLPANANRALTETSKLVKQISGTIDELGPHLFQSLASIDRVAQSLEKSLPAMETEISKNLNQLEITLSSFANTSDQLRTTLAPESPLLYTLDATMREVMRASRSINTLARSLEEQPQSLLLGRGDDEDSIR